jgi:hypothetical protein
MILGLIAAGLLAAPASAPVAASPQTGVRRSSVACAMRQISQPVHRELRSAFLADRKPNVPDATIMAILKECPERGEKFMEAVAAQLMVNVATEELVTGHGFTGPQIEAAWNTLSGAEQSAPSKYLGRDAVPEGDESAIAEIVMKFAFAAQPDLTRQSLITNKPVWKAATIYAVHRSYLGQIVTDL